MTDGKAILKPLNEAFMGWANKGEARPIANAYTEDGVLLPPGSNGARLAGREQILGFWEKAIASGMKFAKLGSTEVWASGSGTLIEEGRYETTSGGAGSYVVIWKKVGDDWKLAKDIFN